MKKYGLLSGRNQRLPGGHGADGIRHMRRERNYGRYIIWVLVAFAIAGACFAAGALASKPKVRQESAVPNTIYETETVTENQLVINQKDVEPVSVSPREEFYLVSETGYLLVFAQDQTTICLHTHIPITEFPEKEQEKLREGIWFESMMEIFHYLESYTS